MRTRTARLLLLTTIFIGPVACAPADDGASVVVALDLAVSQAALEIDPDAPLRDAYGLYDLPLIAAYVALEVTADDMETVSAEWPEHSTDLAGFDGTAIVALEVPPGDARAIDGLVLSWDDGRARLYTPPTPLLVDLAGGAVEDIELVLAEADYGTLSGTAPEGVIAVEIVDQVTDVILARALPDDIGLFEVDDLPVQRPLYPVWDRGDQGRILAPELATHIPSAGGGATFPAPR